MKKRVFCLAFALMLLCALPAQADMAANFSRLLKYGTLVPYHNMVYGYSVSVYSKFTMLTDAELDDLWANLDANREEGDDEIYDLRIWLSPDSRYQMEVQVKQPTYDSFETEVEMAPRYAELVADGYAPENHMRQLHGGILRDTPAGQMLETAIAYDHLLADGGTLPVVFVYYDAYAGGVEFCFSLFAYDGDYESAQSLLDDIMQTVSLHVETQL